MVDRLTAADSQLGSILRLDTSYGGGKTHALIGLHHILTAPGQIPNLDEFVDPATLPGQPVTLAAFDGENADPMNGRRMDANVLAYTPWGELAVQLAGPAGYERIRNSDRFGAPPPGAETLRELIGQRPVLILIDYLAVLHWEGHTVEQANVQLPELVVRLFREKGDNAKLRLNRNNLVFVCGLGGHKLLLVEGSVLRRLKAGRVSLAKLRKGESRRDPLSEELALAMGLLFKLLAPIYADCLELASPRPQLSLRQRVRASLSSSTSG